LTPKTSPAVSAAAMVLLAVIWGLSIPATKLGLATVPPLTLTALRFAVAVPLLLIFLIGKPLPARSALPRVAALGLLGVTVGQVAQALGVEGASASAGTIISATIPVFVVVFAAFRLKQPVTGWQQLGLLAAFAGIALVAMGGEEDASAALQTSWTGAAWLLLSAVTIAFYYVWSVELTREYGTVVVAAWSTLFGFVATLPWAAWEAARMPIHIAPQALWVAAYLGIAVTVGGLFLWLYVLRLVPARVAASVQYLQPVVGMIAASAMFGDELGPLFVAGVVLVFCGLALSIAPRSKRAEVAN
jgi:drug/metabolite transporter (DMT)-like permease